MALECWDYRRLGHQPPQARDQMPTTRSAPSRSAWRSTSRRPPACRSRSRTSTTARSVPTRTRSTSTGASKSPTQPAERKPWRRPPGGRRHVVIPSVSPAGRCLAASVEQQCGACLDPCGSDFPMRAQAHNCRCLTSTTGPSRDEDDRVHDWYRFVLGFPPSLVRDYLPSSGCPTLTESSIRSPERYDAGRMPEGRRPERGRRGQSARPFRQRRQARLDAATGPASAPCGPRGRAGQDRTRAAWHPPRRRLRDRRGRRSLLAPPAAETERLLLGDSISPIPLHRTLVLLDCIRHHADKGCEAHELLALAKILPTEVGNLRFGPEVGVGRKKEDSPVVDLWREQVERMADDLESLPPPPTRTPYRSGEMLERSARRLSRIPSTASSPRRRTRTRRTTRGPVVSSRCCSAS